MHLNTHMIGRFTENNGRGSGSLARTLCRLELTRHCTVESASCCYQMVDCNKLVHHTIGARLLSAKAVGKFGGGQLHSALNVDDGRASEKIL